MEVSGVSLSVMLSVCTEIRLTTIRRTLLIFSLLSCNKVNSSVQYNSLLLVKHNETVAIHYSPSTCVHSYSKI